MVDVADVLEPVIHRFYDAALAEQEPIHTREERIPHVLSDFCNQLNIRVE